MREGRLHAPFFPWPLLQNSTETLASQAKKQSESMNNKKKIVNPNPS